MQTNIQMTIEMIARLEHTKDEHVGKVVLILDKYLMEGEYWLQNTSTVLELQFRHHQSIYRRTNRTSGMYT